MKADSVKVNFGSRVRYKDTDTIVRIAKTATGPQYHGLLKEKPDLIAIGDDRLVEHSIEYQKRHVRVKKDEADASKISKAQELKEKVFRLVTSYRKNPRDSKPAYTFKSKFLSVGELKKQAQDFLKVSEIALKHNLSQEEVDKLGANPSYVERYATLKATH